LKGNQQGNQFQGGLNQGNQFQGGLNQGNQFQGGLNQGNQFQGGLNQGNQFQGGLNQGNLGAQQFASNPQQQLLIQQEAARLAQQIVAQQQIAEQQRADLIRNSPGYQAFQQTLNGLNYLNSDIFQNEPPQNISPPGKLNGYSVGVSSADLTTIANLASVSPNTCNVTQTHPLSEPANRFTSTDTTLNGLSKYNFIFNLKPN
jgi:hypothetical protein